MLDPKGWRNTLRNCISTIECDDNNAYEKIIAMLDNRTLFFIGNGGSAAICSHMAIDYTKNGEYKAMAFNDAAAITCLSNDFRYQEVFKYQIKKWANKDDILFAISSSGESPNILNAVSEAVKKGCFVVTLSAFKPNNSLRNTGNINFYVPTMEYGFAEITHLSILHSLLDIAMKGKQ